MISPTEDSILGRALRGGVALMTATAVYLTVMIAPGLGNSLAIVGVILSALAGGGVLAALKPRDASAGSEAVRTSAIAQVSASTQTTSVAAPPRHPRAAPAFFVALLGTAPCFFFLAPVGLIMGLRVGREITAAIDKWSGLNLARAAILLGLLGVTLALGFAAVTVVVFGLA